MSLINIKNSPSKTKPTRYYSKKQESDLAKKVSGTRTLNSGATAFSKGDVRSDKILFECKTKVTPSESISIKKEWLEKNLKESLFMGKDYSILAFNFGPNESNYYVLDESTFMDFLDYIENK